MRNGFTYIIHMYIIGLYRILRYDLWQSLCLSGRNKVIFNMKEYVTNLHICLVIIRKVGNMNYRVFFRYGIVRFYDFGSAD